MIFSSGDLHYAIGKADFYLTGSKKNGKWTVTISGGDKYDFNTSDLFKELSFNGAAIALGWAMERIGMMVVYEWSVSFSYTYKK